MDTIRDKNEFEKQLIELQRKRYQWEDNTFEFPALFAYGPFETPFELFGPHVIVIINKEDTKQ